MKTFVLWMVGLLALGCSGRVEQDPDGDAGADRPIVTMCTDDASISADVDWAIEYWAASGDAVADSVGRLCSARVIVSDSPMSELEWSDTETAREMHSQATVSASAPSLIVLRKSKWDRMDCSWRLYTLAHEVGHALGHSHDEPSPMLSFVEDADVDQWWLDVAPGLGSCDR